MNWLQCLLLLGFGFSWALVGGVSVEPTSLKTELNWPDECIPGPRYWCQNLASAKECGALDHCAQTVWVHQPLEEVDDSSACKTCVDYITGFQNVTTNNITEKQLEIVLDGICLLIPQSLISKECELAVKISLPEVQSFIKNINPHRFCSVIFICNAASTSKDYFRVKNIEVPAAIETQPETKKEAEAILAPASEKQNKKIDCQGCYTLFTTGKKMIKKSSRDDVLNRMLEICGELSSFSDLCSANVITYFPTIYHHLDTMQVDDACHLSGVCDELYHFHEPTVNLQTAIDNAPEEANDEVCEFCLAMVDHLKTIIIANSTELEFKQVLEGICKQTGNFKDQCLQIVDQYYELIYQFVVNELDPKEVCQEVKLCVPKSVSVEIKNVFPLSPVVPTTIDLDEALKNETSVLSRVDLEKTPLDFSKPLILVGAKRCTWGPSYWCTNMTTSKECNATKHCIHSMWEKMELPADNGDICNICKDMVKQARDQLNSNETQEELREVFEGSCKLIPVKIARKECIKAVDEFVPELVETLSSQMNPQIVCATVGLCNSARMDSLLMQAKTDKSLLETEEIAPLPLNRMFPSLLTSGQKEEVEERGKEACEICELMLHFVQQQMTLPKSEAEIKTVVNSVCVKLPHNVATQCSSFIEVYGDSFIALLAQQIDPSLVCPRIGACVSFLGSVDLEMANESVNHFNEDSEPEPCPVCLKLMQDLHTILNNDRSEVNVHRGLNMVCSKIHSQWAPECKQIVDTYGDNIFDSAVAGFSAHETCYYVKMCSLPELDGVDTNEVLVPVLKDENVFEVEGGNSRCVLCEFIMYQLGNLLQNRKTAEEIKDGVLSVCDHMPVNVKPQCKRFCNQYADTIIGMLTYSWDADKVCSVTHLCHANNTEIENTDTLEGPVSSIETSDIFDVELLKDKDNAENADERCITCEFVMRKLEKELKNNKTVEEIKTVVHTVCNHMPHTIRPKCNDFVKKYGDMVIDLLALSMDPRQVCTALHLCKPKAVLESKVAKCLVCEALIGTLQGLSSDSHYISILNNDLYEACGKLPEKFHEPCISLVVQLAPQIEAIAHTIPSSFICSHLKVCNKNYQHVEILNSEGCSQGPEYWCASTVNAASCGVSAIEHCQQHIWKASKPKKSSLLVRKMLIAPSN